MWGMCSFLFFSKMYLQVLGSLAMLLECILKWTKVALCHRTSQQMQDEMRHSF